MSAARQVSGTSRTKTTIAFTVLCLGFAFASPAPYLLVGLDDMADVGAGLAEHYVDQPAGIRAVLLIHVVFSAVALALVPLQISTTIRRRWPLVHRATGRIAAGVILVGGLSGLVIAQVSYAGLSGTVGFSMLSIAWIGCLWRSVTQARAGNYASHKSWSVRVIALTFAAVTLRIWLFGYISVASIVAAVDFDQAFDQIYVVLPFLSWVPNLLVAEWWVRRTRQGHDAHGPFRLADSVLAAERASA